jgi:hypothetical protein
VLDEKATQERLDRIYGKFGRCVILTPYVHSEGQSWKIRWEARLDPRLSYWQWQLYGPGDTPEAAVKELRYQLDLRIKKASECLLRTLDPGDTLGTRSEDLKDADDK